METNRYPTANADGFRINLDANESYNHYFLHGQEEIDIARNQDHTVIVYSGKLDMIKYSEKLKEICEEINRRNNIDIHDKSLIMEDLLPTINTEAALIDKVSKLINFKGGSD